MCQYATQTRRTHDLLSSQFVRYLLYLTVHLPPTCPPLPCSHCCRLHMVHASREYSRKPFLRSGNRIAYSRESHFFVLPPNLYLTLLLLYTSCESWLQPVLLHHQPFEYTITLNESSWEMTIHLFRDSLTITFSKKTCQILSIMPSSTTESHSLRASVRACVYFFCGAALHSVTIVGILLCSSMPF